jgi:hypothetical protein
VGWEGFYQRKNVKFLMHGLWNSIYKFNINLYIYTG